jgi:hypothetical protein
MSVASLQKFSSNVIEKCLKTGDEEIISCGVRDVLLICCQQRRRTCAVGTTCAPTDSCSSTTPRATPHTGQRTNLHARIGCGLCGCGLRLPHWPLRHLRTVVYCLCFTVLIRTRFSLSYFTLCLKSRLYKLQNQSAASLQQQQRGGNVCGSLSLEPHQHCYEPQAEVRSNLTSS